MLCKDCLQCREDLDRVGVAYQYLDFGDSLVNLKEFLELRDSKECFYEAKENGSIGIPCIVKEDGTVLLDWEQFLM